MSEIKDAADRVFDGEMSVVDYIGGISEDYGEKNAAKAYPLDSDYWKMVKNARAEGKKLIYVSGPFPTELIYAMDCIPLCLDLIPTRLCENPELTAKLIAETDKRVDPDFCALNRAEMGALLRGNLGFEPDAYVSVPIPCDSARTAYSVMSRFIDALVFNFDIPLRMNDRSLEYVAKQLEAFIGLLEKLTGKKLDWDSMKRRMERSNRAGELLDSCTRLRRNRPCPMSLRMSVWNELMNAMAPTEEMVGLLEKELELCEKRAAEGESPCPGGEKHRVLLFHNLFWQGLDISEWLESEYKAVTVMDGFCFRERDFFERLDDRQDCIRLMCKRMLTGAAVHGAAVSAFELSEMAEKVIGDYGVDVSIFLGNAGCRHSWAAQKLVTDSILEKFGLPTLTVDVDNTDRRYKSEKDIKIAIAEYMDTVVNKR